MKDQASIDRLNATSSWMTTKQLAKIRWLVERVEHFELREHTVVFLDEVRHCDSFAAVSIRWKRTDCEENSPRMVVCSGGYNFHVARGGASKLTMSYGLYDNTVDLAITARLYNSTTFHYKPSKEVIAARCAKAREALSKRKFTVLAKNAQVAFIQIGSEVYRTQVSDLSTLDIYGHPCAKRWECSRAHWDRFRENYSWVK